RACRGTLRRRRWARARPAQAAGARHAAPHGNARPRAASSGGWPAAGPCRSWRAHRLDGRYHRAVRLRELGLATGRLPLGRWNAITDVAGVRVGHATLIEGHRALLPGSGPVRTGATVAAPHDAAARTEP